MGTETIMRCNKIRSHLNAIEELVDDFKQLSEDNERCVSVLNEIFDKDFGSLGGEESWSVDHWHSYIRSVIKEFRDLAKEAL